MNVEQLNSRIATVNAETKRLNNERQTNIGRRNELSDQLNKALVRYKETYGVELTIDNLDAEVARVAQLKEQEISTVEQVLALIREGRYEEARVLCEGKQETAEHVQQEVMQSAMDDMAQEVSQPVAPVVQESVPTTPVAPQPTAPIADATPVAPVAPATPVAPVTQPAAPVASQPTPVVPTAPVETPIAPPPVANNGFFGAPSAPSAPLSGLDVPPAPPTQTAPTFPNLGTPVETKPNNSLSGLMDGVGAPPTPPTPPTSPRKEITSFGTILQGGQPFNP